MKSLRIHIILFTLFLLLPFTHSWGQDTKIHVLFIGNSLTSVNDLPGRVAELARSRHFDMDYDMYAPGGYRLSQHADDLQLLDKINKGTWDWVILQEQSQLPGFALSQVQKEVFPYAEKLCRLIRNANPQAHIAFYETMAPKNGDQMNVNSYPELATYNGTQERINASYVEMAGQNQGILVPVGLIWQKIRYDNPSIELYADEKHPNLTGTYLAAYAFYAIIFKDRAVGLPHPPQIDDQTALYLQTTTDEIISSHS